jgi:hypothetical protein
MLLAGSSGGVVALYSAVPLEPVSGSLLPSATYIHPKLRDVAIAAPGRYAQSSCIRRVAINPIDKKSFIAIANQSFYIWDMGNQVEQQPSNTHPTQACHATLPRVLVAR